MNFRRSSYYLEKLEKILKEEKVNYIMHTSRTADSLKKELENVNKFWINYQVVLYSPTIECGVDFNEKHFDKIYCVMKNGSHTCSQRSFLQMVGRIRQLECYQIMCYYDGPVIVNAPIHTFDDMLNYFRHFEELNGKKVLQEVTHETEIVNGEITIKRKKTDISLFDYINIFNEVEQFNKQRNIFMTVFNKLVQRAGHELKFMTTKSQKTESSETYIDQISALDETKYHLATLLKKQAKNDLDSTEKIALAKIFFKKTFGITKTDDKGQFSTFFSQYQYETFKFKRFETLLGYHKYRNDNELDTYGDAKEKARQKIMIDLLNLILDKNRKTYTLEQLSKITFNSKQYNDIIDNIIEHSLYFANENKNRALFFKAKGSSYVKAKTKQSRRYYISTIQAILSKYYINLKRGKQKKKNGKCTFEYSLSVDKEIQSIVKFKHDGEEYDNKDFSSLFQ